MSFDVCGSKMDNKVADNSCLYWFEKFRIESFKYWPVPYVDVRELARNGFYYYRINNNVQCVLCKPDMVKCAFCNVIIGNWEADDSVQGEHKKFSPNCPMVKQKAITNNVPLIKKELFSTPECSCDCCPDCCSCD